MLDFISGDEARLLVLIGISGEQPSPNVLIELEEEINEKINDELRFPEGRETVKIISEDDPSKKQRMYLGEATQHVQQYEVKTLSPHIDQYKEESIEKIITDKLKRIGFSIVGTGTSAL